MSELEQQGEREALAQQHARARRAAAFPHRRYDGRPPQPDDYVAADVTLATLAAQPPRVTPSAEEVLAPIEKVLVDWGAGSVHRPRSPYYQRLRVALDDAARIARGEKGGE